MSMLLAPTVTRNSRPVLQVVTSESLLEGGGFPVRRPFPIANLQQVDPFLLLDHMGPVDWAPGAAIGAPDHPHRGFETVTYLLEGRMQHKDSGGHVGNLGPGDVQWMTAGAGVIHSELPNPEFLKSGGVVHGFQLWVNLPAVHKMMSPRYQDIPAKQIPVAQTPDGRVGIRVVAGEALGASAIIDTVIPITFLHVSIQPGGMHEQPATAGDNAFAYVFAGQARVGESSEVVGEGQIALFGDGDSVRLAVDPRAEAGAEMLFLAGAPLDEPVVRYGPFVMNTRAQVEQALRDYRDGVLVA